MGTLVVVLGLSFLGVLPPLQRDLRLHRTPTRTVAGAALLGVVFSLGWTPCIGPALAAVQSLALSEASAVRGAVLGFAFCLGLGIPFLVLGQLMHRGVVAVGVLRRNSTIIMRTGGLLLVAIGVAEVTGWWNSLTIALRVWAAGWTVPL
jgi:cytochrome c-type biogenesis protein